MLQQVILLPTLIIRLISLYLQVLTGEQVSSQQSEINNIKGNGGK